MGEPPAAKIASSLLFELCASDLGDDKHWSEFIIRFNPLLVRSITVTWRKYTGEAWPPPEISSDLLQDVYTIILKDNCRLLRQFRGGSEAEAEAYLAHSAINQVISYLRARLAKKRQAELISLDALKSGEQDAKLFADNAHRWSKGLSSQELLDTLKQIITGPNSHRDILIFTLNVVEGWTAPEIARMGICKLKETSIANLLVEMKAQVKKYYSVE
ncbi:MAG: RNA polymerase sigma factor [Blastocatellales bacterium]